MLMLVFIWVKSLESKFEGRRQKKAVKNDMNVLLLRMMSRAVVRC